MGRKKPRLNDEHKRYNDRVSLFQHYTNGGPQPQPDRDAQARPPASDKEAAESGETVWPPELMRLREALARARDDEPE